MSLQDHLPASWADVIPGIMSDADIAINSLVDVDEVRPRRGSWFEAFRRVKPADIKIVLIGQDPYYTDDKRTGIPMANGMSFSVTPGSAIPKSLLNIMQELRSDVGATLEAGDLSHWADQGVLLLNASLTTVLGQAGAHRREWKNFRSKLITFLNKREDPIVFILWGNDAIALKDVLHPRHITIQSAHPSPLSSYRGFFGSKPFSKSNEALVSLGKTPINW